MNVASSPPLPGRLRRAARSVRRAVLRRRRWLAAACAGVAVAAGVHAAAPPPSETTGVWVAARDLAAGTEVVPDDVLRRQLDPMARPDGAVPDSPVGAVLASPLRAGEPVTDVRLWDGALVAAHPGLTAVPVRLSDPGAASLLEPGDTVDLWATGQRSAGSSLVVGGARVVTLPPVDDASAGSLTGRLVVLAVDPQAVPTVQEASARRFLSWSLGPLP